MTLMKLYENLGENYFALVSTTQYIEDRMALLREFPEKAFKEVQILHKLYKKTPLPYKEFVEPYKNLIVLMRGLGFKKLINDVTVLVNLFGNEDFNCGPDDYIKSFKLFEKKLFDYILKIQDFITDDNNKKTFGAIELYQCIDMDFYKVLASNKYYNQETQFLTKLIELEQSGKIKKYHSFIQNKDITKAVQYLKDSNLFMEFYFLGIYNILNTVAQLEKQNDEKYQKFFFITNDMYCHNLLYGIHRFREINKI